MLTSVMYVFSSVSIETKQKKKNCVANEVMACYFALIVEFDSKSVFKCE